MTARGGILVVRKAAGMTSFACVARIRRAAGVRRAGHCGTLDPFAEGVLPICIGRATGLVRYMEGFEKEYRVTVRFGSETDTQDATGRPTGGRAPTAREIEAIRSDDDRVLRGFVDGLTGDRMQKPPMYSAVKVGGRPLYESARKGIEVERKARPIRILSSTTESVSDQEGILRAVVAIRCSKGTYIRSLCEDLGQSTGFGAHAETLLRTACGPYRLEMSRSLEEIEAACQASEADPLTALHEIGWLLPLESAVSRLPSAEVDAEAAFRVASGQEVRPEALHLDADGPETVAVLQPGLGLLAVCRRVENGADGPAYRAERVFAGTAGEECIDG